MARTCQIDGQGVLKICRRSVCNFGRYNGKNERGNNPLQSVVDEHTYLILISITFLQKRTTNLRCVPELLRTLSCLSNEKFTKSNSCASTQRRVSAHYALTLRRKSSAAWRLITQPLLGAQSAHESYVPTLNQWLGD